MALYNIKPNYQTLITSLIAVKSNMILLMPLSKCLKNYEIKKIAGSSLSEFKKLQAYLYQNLRNFGASNWQKNKNGYRVHNSQVLGTESFIGEWASWWLVSDGRSELDEDVVVGSFLTVDFIEISLSICVSVSS